MWGGFCPTESPPAARLGPLAPAFLSRCVRGICTSDRSLKSELHSGRGTVTHPEERVPQFILLSGYVRRTWGLRTRTFPLLISLHPQAEKGLLVVFPVRSGGCCPASPGPSLTQGHSNPLLYLLLIPPRSSVSLPRRYRLWTADQPLHPPRQSRRSDGDGVGEARRASQLAPVRLAAGSAPLPARSRTVFT